MVLMANARRKGSLLLTGSLVGLVLTAGGRAQAQKPAPAPVAAPASPAAVKFYPEPDRAALEALQMKPAPELEDLQWVQSGPATIAAQKGKVVLLVFWSRLCGPCIAALSQVQGLETKYGKQGLELISIHDPIASANLKEALNGASITYPVAVEGTARKNIAHYQVRGYPYFTFIDRAGKIRYADVLFDSLEQAAEELLKEPAPK